MGKRKDKEAVLEIGQKLFREKGYHNTGTEEILETAKYPRSSFYYHFKSKEGFGEKTLEFYGERLARIMESFVSDKEVESPLQRIKNYFLMISEYASSSQYEDCCLVQRFAIEAGEKPNPLQKEAHGQLMGWVEIMMPCVSEGQEVGEIRTDMTSREVAEFFFTVIYGGFTLGKLSRRQEELQSKMELAFKLVSP